MKNQNLRTRACEYVTISLFTHLDVKNKFVVCDYSSLTGHKISCNDFTV